MEAQTVFVHFGNIIINAIKMFVGTKSVLRIDGVRDPMPEKGEISITSGSVDL